MLTPVVAFADIHLQPLIDDNGTPGVINPGDTGSVPTPTVRTSGESVELINPLKVDSLEEFLAAILKFIVRLGTIVVVVMIVVVGFMFVAARGNPEAISKARTALLWTLVGAVILIGAEIIAQAIAETVKAIGS